MRGKGSRSAKAVWGFLAAAAALTTMVASASWVRLGRASGELRERERQMAAVLEHCRVLTSLQAELGEAALSRGSAGRQDLIPFLESAAARAGIPKEGITINTGDAEAVPSRPGVSRAETRVDVEPTSMGSLVQFLVAAEEQFPTLEVREVVARPLGEGRGWSARLLISVARREG
jgi:hypothetical protein